MENIERSKGSKTHLSKISAFMGFLGAINSATIGFYVLSTLFNPIQTSISMVQGYIISQIIAIVIVTLTCGSYLILKNKHAERGAEINFTTGLFLAFFYIYYTYLSRPSLFSWLGMGGMLLIIPPILSGIIGKVALG